MIRVKNTFDCENEWFKTNGFERNGKYFIAFVAKFWIYDWVNIFSLKEKSYARLTCVHSCNLCTLFQLVYTLVNLYGTSFGKVSPINDS